MRNKLIWIGAIVGFILGIIILISALYENIVGLPLFIIAGIIIYLLKIFLGPCSPEYGDFLCEERIEYVLHNTGLFSFLAILFLVLCAFIGALIGLVVNKFRR